jgi:CHAT domain-containing protein
MVPSATLWLRLRRSGVQRARHGALVFADPDLAHDTPGGAAALPPLPWARQEARGIASLLGLGAGDVLEGRAASEGAIKTAPLGAVGVLHLAAHARADAVFPERSAVFLAPGGEGEDGWLQPREIAALHLHGQLVVLSACESADGSLQAGEGALSLARAFFAAGAGGVVAARWPLRDDDAAFVMERFYRRLAAGDTVGAALRRVRRDALDAGLPAATWAGVAFLGVSQQSPIALREHPHAVSPPVVVMALLIAVALGAWARRLRTRHKLR